ncbi:Hsp70 family protein [Mucilaginibacter rubeus]|uniref:Hsp70 family protein n=1 Tax=Mucilaginibacter rubeus TaxID=2027860 RepID=A0AAE6JCQ4_9SPHI|nr:MULTISPECIES: Hsp70 family protein [Mucilaginibacter]QEM03145.1 Hsp70 family protein [Mucilaginibacter rubeus]QEM15764.1 Hsp70 family protein [Mucilaginibacter gossypii]QTE41496.1 Hsp70 family protein [Mucilaginibacter rubeus]QTE48101.1 Hsp70 family protein [Mucilaginibacter rubeus]QTE59493.1 Hsp70 family protein [Mucilaginibacter rubeus]
MENINFGIDLGTTNSAIAKFTKGQVHVYNNPTDFGRNTLPSVVGFRKDKIIVGNQAKTYYEKDPKSVVGVFKRRMGTSESFKIKAINESKSPVELSAIVLKELKTFLPPGESIDAAVITIPASFDTTQASATKEAGLQAGFKQVILLQEPIAASLAYANMKKEKELADGQWLVYDFGGGTFDVALIKIKDGEMRVLDHEGDNFLGGADFDRLIIEKLIVPKIEKKYSIDGLLDSFQSGSGRLNGKYYALLHLAEQAKILLSAKSSAEIEVSGFTDENDNEIDEEMIISRSEFNELIKDYVDVTIDMVKKILTRNSLKPSDVNFTLMVGGSTYIPYVRQRVEEILQIPINCEIDPTTAVAIGAAHYASGKTKDFSAKQNNNRKPQLSVKAAYLKTSKEKEELFSAKITGNIEGLFYRIKRADGGFDTGLKPLSARISEDLPLVENVYNFFDLTVYNGANDIIETDLDTIGINSGFGISGQPLPEDISLEVDDDENPGETKLLLVFQKNSVLPLKRTITRQLNKTVIKGSVDELIRINVLEGPYTALPEANKRIGYFEITGKNLIRDIHKGSDVEITIQMTESRDLTVSTYLTMADQEFKEIYNPKERNTPVSVLKLDIENLSVKLDEELEQATQTENYEAAKELLNLKREMEAISENASDLTDDDITDKRYQLEDKKRKVALDIGNATMDKRIAAAKSEYFEAKQECEELLDENGNDHERKYFNDVVAQENIIFSSSNPLKIREFAESLHSIRFNIMWRTPDFLVALYNNLSSDLHKMNDASQAKSLSDAGKFAIESKNWSRLSEIDRGLLNLLPKAAQQEATRKIGF